MRSVLLIIFIAISSSASAQWWRVNFLFKKHYRPPAIEQDTDHSIARLPAVTITIGHPEIYPVEFGRSDYSIEAAEDVIMRTAQHNMRFRVYADASYNFSDLAHLYIQENRFSEAKWYLLQSNLISRQENDDKHTILNLIDLAFIKTSLGDYALAQQDLTEAHDLACAKGFNEYLEKIEQMMLCARQTGKEVVKPVLRYAETPQNNGKTE